jgi:hypothetical protein
MDAQFANILTDLHALARQHGWQGVAERIDALLQGGAPAILVAATEGIDSSALCEWIGRTAPGLTIDTSSLESLGSDPTRAASAGHVIVLFPCNCVPTGESVNVLSSAVFARPAGSYAVVLTGMEHIAAEQDLAAVERFAWHLLVPGPKADWDGQRLADHDVYLWSEQPPTTFLAERLRGDSAALARRLREAMPSSDLDRSRVAAALALAEMEVRRAAPPSPADTPEPPPFPLQEALINLRRQMLARITADAAALERTLLVGLHTLRQDLRDGLASYLARLSLPRCGDTAPQTADAVAEYIAEGLRDWHRHASIAVAEWEQAAEADWRGRFDLIDWPLINRLAGRAGKAGDYPESLYRRLALLGGDGMALTTPSASEPSSSDSHASVSLLRVGLATGVLPVLAWLGGAGPVGAVAAGVGGAVAVGMYESRSRSARSFQEWQAAGRNAISETVDRAEQAVREHLSARRDQLRRALQEEFDLLDRVVAEGVACATADPLDRSRADLAALEDMHRRLLEIP